MRTRFRRALLACNLLCIAGAAFSSDIETADWVWNIDDPEGVYAATYNTAENLLAQFCYPESGKCVYAVAFGTKCEEGSEYPALVNTDQGAYFIKLECGSKLDGGEHLMFVQDFDQIDQIVRKAIRIGFVMPMQGDEFKAVRFSLRGANEALDLMRLAGKKLRARQSDKPSIRPAVERL